jgi:hypothetical protein
MSADPRELLDQLGAVYSPDLNGYAAGRLDASRVRCALCRLAPCQCPPFGSAAYFDLLDRVHGRPARPRRTCSAPGCPLTPIVGEHPRGLATSGPAAATCTADGPREDDTP